MPLGTFERLLPAFGRTELVFLQGWGEPFLHPDLPAMMSMAKIAGCKVGTTTNGMLLDVKTMRRLVESGMDVLAFSLAGIDERNDAIRRGTSLRKVLSAIQALHKMKKSLGSKVPEVHIAYMLLRSGLEEVQRLPDAVQGLGVGEVVVSTLDFVACKELEAETIAPATEQEYSELQTRLEAVKVEGERRGLGIHYQLCRPGERRPTCTENVQRALFVAADGTVSACVFANLPVSQPIHMYRDVRRRHQRVVFGNINDAPPATIWRRRAYRSWRRAFYRGRLPVLCEGCPKLFIA
jgi:MoaA/NifB/PqqE/SkfB family radical SAM enzyme